MLALKAFSNSVFSEVSIDGDALCFVRRCLNFENGVSYLKESKVNFLDRLGTVNFLDRLGIVNFLDRLGIVNFLDRLDMVTSSLSSLY
jgi:hypothetical protein